MQVTFNKWFTLVLAGLSAVVGAGFGFLGHLLYNRDFIGTEVVKIHNSLGIILAMVLRFGTGWGYSLIMLTFKQFTKRGWQLVIAGCLIGVFAGLICSTVFHFILMRLYNTTSTFPMEIGAWFGGGAGLLLGVVFSSVLAKKVEIPE